METRYENNLVCLTQVLSLLRLYEGILFKTCVNPRVLDQNINGANLYENEMV